MGNPIRRLNLLLFILLLVFPAGNVRAQAQPLGRVSLLPPQTDNFPTISTYLDVHDSGGNFISGLNASQVSILEDGQTLPIDELKELSSGAEFVLAVNPGPSFAVRDAQGNDRYRYIVEALRNWVIARSGSDLDDLSLTVTGGPEVSHTNNLDGWFAPLDAFHTELRSSVPSVQSLSRALDIIMAPSSKPGMGRGLLWITAPLDAGYMAGVQSLLAGAAKEGVQISIWVIGSPDQFTTPVAVQWKSLAEDTGGQFFGYSGEEQIPDLENLLRPLRDIYSLAYTSRLNNSNEHQVSVSIQVGSDILTSTVRSFQLNIAPPLPQLDNPPIEVKRTNPDGDPDVRAELYPKTQPLEMSVQFSDGHNRSLSAATLFVDGQPVARKTAAPFTQFTWDLSGYLTSGIHKLRVDVDDSLGLHGSSQDVEVQVVVERPTASVSRLVTRNLPMFAVLGAILLTALVLLGMVLGGKLQPRVFGRGPRSEARLKMLKQKAAAPPVPAPAPVQAPAAASPPQEPTGFHWPVWLSRWQWPRRGDSPRPVGFLTPLTDDEHKTIPVPIQLLGDVITFGNDTGQAGIILSHPSVAPLHARLRREINTYRIVDEGSTAGTWVNYVSVPLEGLVLEHGDIIHFGRVGFRFTLREPGKLLRPEIAQEESIL